MKIFPALSLLLGMLTVVVPGGAAEAARYRVLYAFGASPGDGYYPSGALYRDNAGNIYGTTEAGGANQSSAQKCNINAANYCGTIFRITSGGVETLLHSFQGPVDGSWPMSGLVRDGAGNLYGATIYGGGAGPKGGSGTLFKITPEGDFTVLHAFEGGRAGHAPVSMLLGKNGNLYAIAPNYKAGAALELSTTGQVLFTHLFGTGSDGAGPGGNLVQDHAGNVYGTTAGGGTSCESPPFAHGGTIFKIDPNNVYTSFAFGCDIPQNEPSGLAVDGSHHVYGVTLGPTCEFQGNSAFCGSVFKVMAFSRGGGRTTLHTFADGDKNDGREPQGPLVIGKDGNLYGATVAGGAYDNGTIYRMSKDGTVTILHSFAKPIFPENLMMDNKGRLYGTSYGGGAHKKGFVFMLDPNTP